MEGKTFESEIGGNLNQKLGGEVAPNFDSRFGGIEATANRAWHRLTSLIEHNA